jgi:octaprenyl-diphosphate synthase
MSENPFTRLNRLVAADLDMVNQTILSLAKHKNLPQQIKADEESMISQITDYLMTAGGKRLRPMLTLACANLFDSAKAATGRHVKLAAAVELIHTATLLHDDVVDDSPSRRGVRTVNNIWGNKASILVGDYLLSQSFKLMVECGNISALRILSEVATTISAAEVWQLEVIGDLSFDYQAYIRLITAKTASLFSAACEVGGIIAAASVEQSAALREYGNNLGISFQIVDDILDYISEDKNFGKEAGGDLAEGKVTLPVIIAFERASSADKELLRQVFTTSLGETRRELKRVIELLNRYNSIQDSFKWAHKYVEDGVKALSSLPQSAIKDQLIAVIEHSLERQV